jgi:hypothetical protein
VDYYDHSGPAATTAAVPESFVKLDFLYRKKKRS